MGTAMHALGELGLRVNDLDRMQDFYENVLGLEVMLRVPDAVSFRIADGYGGHVTVFNLFARGTEVGTDRSTLDHFGLTIDVKDYESEKQRLEDAGFDVETKVFEWIGWRSLFLDDPEGNHVELVCRDPRPRPNVGTGIVVVDRRRFGLAGVG
jgi:catechol-2,3-dioxygenase